MPIQKKKTTKNKLKKVVVAKKETTTKKERSKEEIVGIIVQVIKDGGSITEACRRAEIHRDTFYEWKKNDAVFADKIEYAENYMNEIAKGVIVKSIREGNTNDAKWWLERKAKAEFSPRHEITDKDGNSVFTGFQVNIVKHESKS